MDNDPHFIVHLPRADMDVCFNINSKPGHILNLVSDSGTGSAPPSPPLAASPDARRVADSPALKV